MKREKKPKQSSNGSPRITDVIDMCVRIMVLKEPVVPSISIKMTNDNDDNTSSQQTSKTKTFRETSQT